jgi:hypothetical protein
MSRVAAVIKNGLVQNVIVIADGEQGDSEIELTGAIETTGIQAGIGWSYKDDQFIAPPKTKEQLKFIAEQAARAERREIAESKLLELGLTVEDLKALLG